MMSYNTRATFRKVTKIRIFACDCDVIYIWAKFRKLLNLEKVLK